MSENKNKTAIARFGGAGTAGACELLIFHPVDTVAKRLMNSKEKLSGANWQRIIFQDQASSSVATKYGSLFPGIGYGAIYKVTQRVYKFGGQPYVKEFLTNQFKGEGKESATKGVLLNGLAGSMMGAGEVVLLPFDVLKIKMQTNPEYRKMSMAQCFRNEGMQLYAGWGWTMARNVPGSFALFGGNALAKSAMGIDKNATFLQTSASSLVGSVTSIIVACPLDVVKTRIQSGNYGQQGGFSHIKNITKEEGLGAFFKGWVPKTLTVGPKLVFSFTIAQYLTAMWMR